MKKLSSQLTKPAKLLAVAALAFSVCGFVGTMPGAEPAFDGGKSTWHDGFVRYDFTMDDETLAITPFTRPEKEGFAVGTPAKGQRRCIVVVPNKQRPAIVVVARLLLGSPAPGRNGIAAPGFLLVHYARSEYAAVSGQAVGRLVRLPHREAWAVQKTGLRGHEQRR